MDQRAALTGHEGSAIVSLPVDAKCMWIRIAMEPQSTRRSWEKPGLTVLMFRATANTPDDGADAVTEGVLVCYLAATKPGRGLDHTLPNVCLS